MMVDEQKKRMTGRMCTVDSTRRYGGVGNWLVSTDPKYFKLHYILYLLKLMPLNKIHYSIFYFIM